MIKEICISGSFLLTERERITPTAIKFLHGNKGWYIINNRRNFDKVKW